MKTEIRAMSGSPKFIGKGEILTAEDMQARRTVKEFCSWVDDIRLRLKPYGIKGEGKKYILHRGLYGKFSKETIPLRHYLQACYQDATNILVQPHMGNENYDAELSYVSGKELFERVEITQIIDGADDHLRTEHLAEYGYASLNGPAPIRGKDKVVIRRDQNELYACNHQESIKRFAELLEKQVEKKMLKSYSEDTALLVYFDDYYPLRTQSERDMQFLHQLIMKVRKRSVRKFKKIIFVGASERVYD